MGTAAINFANTYDKISIFFNFGAEGAAAGEQTYYWDDVEFGAKETVVDIIVNSPIHETLETTVIAAELDDDLSGAGTFTVFAPTDDAFDALPAGLLDALLTDPTGTLAQILLYHVLGLKSFPPTCPITRYYHLAGEKTSP
ncbi:MAG: fasciclin domain-containing protein [Lewinellaceae bacterium]|nr:fasciclin domain-containing protein [Lewinellaceae bacterium]